MDKQLKYAHEAARHPIVQNYVHQVCKYIEMLIKWCGMETQLAEMLHTDDVHSAGQVRKQDVYSVIRQGNIREQQTLIMNFGMHGCIVIWKLIYMYLTLPASVPDFINKKQLEQRLERIMVNLGITDRNMLRKVSILECKKNASLCIKEKTVECSVVSQSKSGLVSMTRSFQVFEPYGSFRTKNDPKTMYTRGIQVINTIVPPLSHREKQFIQEKLVESDSDYAKYYKTQSKPNIPPWITGYMYWSINTDSFFQRLSLINKHMTIAGPSGNTDLQMDVFTLFHNFDITKGTLACIAWMGGIDHSIHEIFVAAIPYGLQDNDFKSLIKQVSRTCSKYKPTFSTERVKSNPKLTWQDDEVCRSNDFNKDYDGKNKKCFDQVRYILGRDTLLVKSGWKTRANTCSDIRVMNLPWDDNDERFSKWTPRVNSKLVHCAVKSSNPIMVLISDYDYNLVTCNYKASNYDDAMISKISFIQTNGPAQTAIEMCQILYFWLSSHKVFVESEEPIIADDVRYHVCWITKKNKKDMINITKPFKEAVLHRMTASVPPDY